MYLKFDISGINAADLVANPYAALRMNIGNLNVNASRQTARILPADPNTTVNMEFALRGLTNFALNNWQENTITYYNAPGITPDATQAPIQLTPANTTSTATCLNLEGSGCRRSPQQNHLAVGSAVDYTEPALGPLHN